MVGKYELLEVLGEGGMATTYLARQLTGGRPVAVKAIQLVKAKNRRQIEMFEREAEALRALRHPQIPTFYETMVGESDETITLYLIQEFVNGRSLQRRLDEDHKFSAAEAVEIMLSCLAPLEYLHKMSPPLYHRDIKPSNIITKSDGTCVLVDFGAVREALADPKVAGSSVVGTFGYMAPEQFQSRVCAGTDLYSLGATAVHLLSGKSPETIEVKRLKPNIHKHIDVDPHLAAILDLLMEPAAEDRYQSAISLRKALNRWVNDHPEQMSNLAGSHRFTPPQQFLAVSQLAKPVERELSVGTVVPKRMMGTLDERRQPALTPVVASPAIALEDSQAAKPPARRPRSADKSAAPKPATEKPTIPARPKPKVPAERAPTSPRDIAPIPNAKTRQRSGGQKSLDVPVQKARDPWWHLALPTSVGCEPIGWCFIAVGALLSTLAVTQKAGIAPLVVSGVLALYGVTYFWFSRRRLQAQRGDQYFDHTDGVLTEVVLHSSALGGSYVTLNYRFGVHGDVFTGRRLFPSREAARPYIRHTLRDMIFYDENDPKRNALDLPLG